jgi:hypothetical protein
MGAAIAPLAVGGQLLGGVVSGFGAMESGQASQAAANYQAQVAQINAGVAKTNATMEMAAGETAANNSEMRTRAAVGATKAGQAAAGIDVNTGSAPQVRASEAELGMLDALTSRANAARGAYGYEVQATSDIAQSQLDVMEGQQAKEAGDISGIASLISGASSAGVSAKKFGWGVS